MNSDNKLPKTALALYVKLYCKKKNTRGSKFHQSILAEAAKSWVTLSKTDKQYFLNIYKEYESKLKEKFALNLQNAKPYLKKKHHENSNCNRSSIIKEDFPAEINNATDNVASCPSSPENQVNNENNNHSSYINQDGNIDIEENIEQLENCHTDAPFESMHRDTEPDVPSVISEPTPPLRTAKELFGIVKNQEESSQNINWTDLSKTQKQRYQRALLIIKKDFLKHYLAYLESLTPQQLFHYYKSKF